MDLQNRAEAGSDGHDESVLNPEMPNETDLTKKERRRIEKEKLEAAVCLLHGTLCMKSRVYRQEHPVRFLD